MSNSRVTAAVTAAVTVAVTVHDLLLLVVLIYICEMSQLVLGGMAKVMNAYNNCYMGYNE